MPSIYRPVLPHAVYPEKKWFANVHRCLAWISMWILWVCWHACLSVEDRTVVRLATRNWILAGGLFTSTLSSCPTALTIMSHWPQFLFPTFLTLLRIPPTAPRVLLQSGYQASFVTMPHLQTTHPRPHPPRLPDAVHPLMILQPWCR